MTALILVFILAINGARAVIGSGGWLDPFLFLLSQLGLSILAARYGLLVGLRLGAERAQAESGEEQE